ncbi:MAG: FkbM family methyltransferase, partial [Planctomycetaceae bacterium]
NSGASSMFKHWRIGSRHERVPAITLDSFFEETQPGPVRLAKIDCEGAERMVLDGAKSVLQRGDIEYLAVELHPHICGQRDCDAATQLLSDAGYEVTEIAGYRLYRLAGVSQ